mgnify:FL=1
MKLLKNLLTGSENLEPEILAAVKIFDEMREKTTDPPGITRPSYGEGENIAHGFVRDLARELNLQITHDYAGNLYMTLPGKDREAPSIVIGSHMDSVPHGGNYDGAAGVIMGMAPLHRLRHEAWQPKQDITVMAIRAEELVWFPTPYAGSRMAFGLLPPEDYDSLKRSDTGRSLADHIADLGFDVDALKAGKAWLDAKKIRHYIEPHIEQGPALVEAGMPVGIVTGIRGNLRYPFCRVEGTYGHAGAVPREYRSDAVFAAVEFSSVLENHWNERDKAGTDFVCTMGEFHTDSSHHGMTKIPGELRFTMDIRSLDFDVLLDTDQYLRKEAARISQERNVTIDLGEFTEAHPAIMDNELRSMLHEQAKNLEIPVMDISSGAGHDCATFSIQGVSCAMIFIRNDKGSHNAYEAMDINDFADATRLLVSFLKSLD